MTDGNEKDQSSKEDQVEIPNADVKAFLDELNDLYQKGQLNWGGQNVVSRNMKKAI